MAINIYTGSDIEKMRAAGQAAASVLEMIEPFIRPGISTEVIDQHCHDFITQELAATPAALHYRGFPKSICTSVNHQVCHGIPGPKTLKAGDIINLDTAIIKDGYFGDTSKMFIVGKASILAKRLIQVTQECMYRAIKVLKPGMKLVDIGQIIETHANKHKYTVVQEYCGHGVGKNFHEEPQVLHYAQPDNGIRLSAGMIFTIEPMINAGKRQIRLLPDDWTVVTKDRSLSAQWEHTVLITDDGYEVLTLRAEEQGWESTIE